MPSTNAVFLSENDCQVGQAQAQVQISNIGGGTLTFARAQYDSRRGAAGSWRWRATSVAPAPPNLHLSATMDPGRSGAYPA